MGVIPVIAGPAYSLDLDPIIFVTRPYTLEGEMRQRVAAQGAATLRQTAPDCVILDNDGLLPYLDAYPETSELYRLVDHLLMWHVFSRLA